MSTPSSLLLLVCTVCLSSCAVSISTQPSDEPVREGMTSQELLTKFGSPRRVERNADGSQDWFYRFAIGESWTGPVPGWDHPNDPYKSDEVSSSVTLEEWPIHLSPDQRVSGDIPPGKLLKKR